MLKRGLAKDLFTATYQRAPWMAKEASIDARWPLLDSLLEQKRLSYLDYVLTHRLLRNYSSCEQDVALFLCHLTLAAKEGHLCVRILESDLIPSVAQLWQNEEGHPPVEEEAQMLTQLMLEGARQIPEGLLTILKEGSSMPHTPICRAGNDYYLQRHWVLETLFLKFLKKHLKSHLHLTLDQQLIQQTAAKLCQENVLLKEQAEAIVQACQHPLTLITGGPGTGKTYTAGHLIKVFWQHLNAEQRKTCQIVLAAPTGKAAANLQRSLSKVTKELEDFPPIQAKTLHALLGIKHGSQSRENVRLAADLILVDESSMIDVRLMACLFESLKEGSRLVLLGDPHQLPSVEAGSVFVDLIHLQKNYPLLTIPSSHLNVCLRAELKSLIEFAKLINQGQAQETLHYLNQSSGQGAARLQFSIDKKEAQKSLVEHTLKAFPTTIKREYQPEELLELFQSIRLLTPMRKGPFGVEELNQLIWQQVQRQASSHGWLAIPILITTNDYRQDLFNGETGVLMRQLPLQPLSIKDYALFPSRQAEEPVRKLPALLLPKYEYAYCLSVHKSQGSEFDRVILALPEGSEIFGREVLYTAVTRARKQIEIYASDAVLLKTIAQQGVRLSGIEQRLTANFQSHPSCQEPSQDCMMGFFNQN